MTPDLAALVEMFKKLTDGADSVALIRIPIACLREAAAVLESLALRIDGYQASRDYAIDLLAKALGVEADKMRAVEYYAREASEKIESLAEENARLTGKMCLICGRPEPCTDTPEACTFDPHPIEAARAFLRRAERAEADRDKAIAKATEYLYERDALVARFSEIAPCDPGDTPALIAARALAKHRELRKDAERYRWLRSELKRVDPLASIVWKHNDDRTSNEWANIGIVDHLDAGIDAAIDAALAGKAER